MSAEESSGSSSAQNVDERLERTGTDQLYCYCQGPEQGDMVEWMRQQVMHLSVVSSALLETEIFPS